MCACVCVNSKSIFISGSNNNDCVNNHHRHKRKRKKERERDYYCIYTHIFIVYLLRKSHRNRHAKPARSWCEGVENVGRLLKGCFGEFFWTSPARLSEY